MTAFLVTPMRRPISAVVTPSSQSRVSLDPLRGPGLDQLYRRLGRRFLGELFRY
jgi:hypothetical protein